MRYLKFSGLAFMLSLCTLTEAEHWDYINPVLPNKKITITSTPPGIGVQHVLHEAKFCDAESDYYCLISEEFEFHIPINLSRITNSWEVSNVEHKLVPTRDIKYIGSKGEIFLIEKKQNDWTMRLIYTKFNGVIGLGAIKDNSTGFYLINGSCGFAADPKCK